MKPVSSPTLAPMIPEPFTPDRPSPNIEPNNLPFEGVYGHLDDNAPSREQVVAELAQAKAAGLLTSGEQDYPPPCAATGPTKTREQVLAELAEAKATGKYHFGELDYP